MIAVEGQPASLSYSYKLASSSTRDLLLLQLMEGQLSWINSLDQVGWRKGPWTPQEDRLLIEHVNIHGEGRWNSVSRLTGLRRSGKSCRLRWVNYLRPDLKRGKITPHEETIILELHARWGNRWSTIARSLPGRTDNEIKNYWRTHFKKSKSAKSVERARERFLKQKQQQQQQQEYQYQYVDEQQQQQQQQQVLEVDSTTTAEGMMMRQVEAAAMAPEMQETSYCVFPAPSTCVFQGGGNGGGSGGGGVSAASEEGSSGEVGWAGISLWNLDDVQHTDHATEASALRRMESFLSTDIIWN